MNIIRLLGDRPSSALMIGLFFLLLLLLPWLHVVPEGSTLHMSGYWITLIGKIMCLAMVALALDLVWGYAGILSLGHGLYFALGGYAFGMYLMRQSAGSELPEFMRFLSWTELPWYWNGTQHIGWALALVVLLPGLIALIFGFFAFRSKIKGVYFSIITQAMTFAATLLFFRNETGFGGNNGFTGFKTILGYDITAPMTRTMLCFATALALMLSYIGLRYLMNKPYGRVLGAIRDSENRLQYLGYRTLWYKLSAWVLSAVIAGIAGALYVPQVGIINPSEMNPVNSIEMAVWVAAGGRGTLIGAIVGAAVINAVKTYFTVAYPEAWLLVLGGLFVGVTLFLPKGIIGLFEQLKSGQSLFARFKKEERQMMKPNIDTASSGWADSAAISDSYGRPKQDGADFTHGIALYLENVSVWFDAFRALNDLSMYIQAGELRCIIGPNGAGKTTLMDVITGKTRPTTGSAFFGQNHDLSKLSTEQIAEAGIGRKFQKPTVFENFSVMENLLLAAPKDKRVSKSLFSRLQPEAQDNLDHSLQHIRLQDYINKPAGLLSHGQKQWLEIGMLLMQRPKLILLDEPVAGMTDAETERTAELCLELKKNHTLVVVEHDMSFIDTISEKVTVLAQGAILAEGTLAEVQASDDVIEKYLGR